MQYAVMVRSLVRSLNRHNDEGSPRTSQRVHYIPAINREHATDMQAGFTQALSMSYRDGPVIVEVHHELVYVIRNAKGDRMYLDQSEVEKIVAEYTTPSLPRTDE